VVAALVAGALLGVSTPALADDPNVQITELSSGNLRTGERANLEYTVENNNDGPTPFSVRVETGEGLSCEGDCNIPARLIQAGETVTFNARLIAGKVGAGQTRNARVRTVAKSNLDGNDEGSDEQTVTIRGPEQAAGVRRISGEVRDLAANVPVENANVTLKDGRGQEFETETNDDGRYAFTSDGDRQIAPGNVAITVRKEGFSDVTKRFNIGAGQSRNNFRISLQSTAVPTPSASAEPTGEPTPDVTDSGAATEPGLTNTAGEQDGGGSTLSWILLILGGLLVALGVGAIVLLVVRRKEGDADDEAATGDPRDPRGPVTASRAAYHGAPADATRVSTRPGADHTMYARPPMADAPTVMQQAVPVDDEFPDPYGAPPTRGPQPGYGAPTPAGYGAAAMPAGAAYGRGQDDGYGPRDFGGDPGPGAPDDRYDEPTGLFNGRPGFAPQPGPGYDDPPYAPPAGGREPRGYDDADGYGRGYAAPPDDYGAPAPARGYPGGGYEARGPAPDPGYDGPVGYDAPPPRYDAPPAGYDAGRGGYDQPPSYDQGGYDDGPDRRGGYDPQGGHDQGGYYDDPGAPSRRGGPPRRNERRSLDWLDD
jgi:hypothetical protein